MIDLTGQNFGRLLPFKRIAIPHENTKYLCRCDCGNKTIVSGNNLKNGNTKSCGCLQKETRSKNGKNNKSHGNSINNKMSKTYRAWISMRERCDNHNVAGYKNYGGRGITVCDRWDINKGGSFENFLEDMEECPTDRYQIDRINNSLGYCKENCHWVLSKENNRNRRNNISLELNGKMRLLIELSEENNIKPNVLWNRIFIYKWPIEKALTTPVRKWRKNN